MNSNCPHCQFRLKVKEEWLGRKIKCPSCKEPFRLPESIAPKATTAAKPTVKKSPSKEPVAPKSSKPKPTASASAKPSVKKPGVKAVSSASAPVAKKASGVKAAAMAKTAAPRAKARPSAQSGSPYKSLFNTIAILGICVPYILMEHNRIQAERMNAYEDRIAQQEAAKKSLENRDEEMKRMQREMAQKAREDAKVLKAELGAEAAAELQAEEDKLAEATFKSMMDKFLALEVEMIKEREEKLAGMRKTILAQTLKEKKVGMVQLQAATDPFFKDNVFGVLKNRCHKCHGNEEAKGGLRLHTRDFTIKGGDGGASIVPGDPAKSLLVELIKLAEDDDDVMPPKGGKLTDKEIAAIEKWIADGAKW